jgi:NDP-sugar pyrophosphorylase family protein
MLPVCGSPLVRWAVLWLRHHGVRQIVINLHHMGDQIEAELGSGRELGVDIAYSREETILGTGGGLRQARSLLDDGKGTPIVALNGKILMELNLADLVARHRARGAEATWVMRRDTEGIWGGSLAADGEGRMATFLGETREGSTPGDLLMFTGVHLFEPRLFDRIPAEGEQCVARTAYRELFRSGQGLDVHISEGYWWEHSTVARYLQGIENVLEGRVDLPQADRPLRGVDPSARVADDVQVRGPVWIGADAEIGAGATIGPHTQIGRGAKVADGITVERSVVWEGVELGRDARGEVFAATPSTP